MLKAKYKEGNFSKWLLVVTLLLSVFAFTGYNANSRSTLQQKAQTEIVCLNHKTASTQTGAYKRSLLVEHKTHQYAANILSHHNRQIKLRLDRLSKTLSPIPIAGRFFQLKTIPQSSSDDTLDSVTG